MQRLAALVPRLRLLVIRFHGLLAPNAKLRPLVAPQVIDGSTTLREAGLLIFTLVCFARHGAMTSFQIAQVPGHRHRHRLRHHHAG